MGITPYENIMGKGENAFNQHFLLFPKCFLTYQRTIAPFEPKWHCRLQKALNLDLAKIFSSGKDLVVHVSLCSAEQMSS